MPELTREEKLKLVEKLPQRAQDFLYSEDTGAFLLYIGEKYNLDDDKISLISKLVGDVILGITPVTSLAQEINSKVISDPQASMNMAQELYSGLLSPVMSETKPAAPSAPTLPNIPTPKTDLYREPISGMPEVVDLRKTPPPQIPVPVSPAPIPPVIKKIEPPAVPTPLIEAEPHKLQEEKIPETPKPPVVSPPTSLGASAVEPQFIIRPPGLAPTDAPHNVLDLRKDKGEF